MWFHGSVDPTTREFVGSTLERSFGSFLLSVDSKEIVAQAVAAAIQNMRNERNDGAGSSNEGIHVWIERFNKLKPNSFLSATTPTAASDWINHCEKLFQVIGCPDGVKARLAAFKFDGDALNWWTSYIQAKSAGFVETCTWEAFREAFYKRFIPLSEQQRFEREYGAIYQEERENAAEYMERFLRLASFVGPTVTGDATRQARHYKWGLKRWVLDRIVNTDYADGFDFLKWEMRRNVFIDEIGE
ncbi:hypothetical protein CTI12_AA323150 [Artemisia annua]|uniref:Retrotransposon gag domain-containing protein n=1 Tax=Artemisia annua TaxID=35608 RepID=A0A2U1N0F2_ARTAN|nr:hypothetical protein CTI12_AA323150 [Artemisia annua]